MDDTSAAAEHLGEVAIPDEIDRNWLIGEYLAPFGIPAESALADLCEDILIAAASQGDATLQMRPGGWRVKTTSTLVKTTLATVLVGAALHATGTDEIPVALLPAVLPLAIDLDRVRLNRKERTLLAPLRIAAAGMEGLAVHPQVLYDRLDQHTRSQLNYGDFEEFCEHLIEAGEMDDGGYDEVRPRHAGDPAWIRITWV